MALRTTTSTDHVLRFQFKQEKHFLIGRLANSENEAEHFHKRDSRNCMQPFCLERQVLAF